MLKESSNLNVHHNHIISRLYDYSVYRGPRLRGADGSAGVLPPPGAIPRVNIDPTLASKELMSNPPPPPPNSEGAGGGGALTPPALGGGAEAGTRFKNPVMAD